MIPSCVLHLLSQSRPSVLGLDEVRLLSHEVQLLPLPSLSHHLFASSSLHFLVAVFLRFRACVLPPPPLPVLVLNDVHLLSRDAQHSLRRTMERYSAACRLILVAASTCQVGQNEMRLRWNRTCEAECAQGWFVSG